MTVPFPDAVIFVIILLYLQMKILKLNYTLMKKLMILALAALFALASCQKVEPTSISYKYTATVQGTVFYAQGNTFAESGYVLEITVNDGVEDKEYAAAINSSNGGYSLSVPCKSSNGITVNSLKFKEYKNDGKTYGYTLSTPFTVKAGAVETQNVNLVQI